MIKLKIDNKSIEVSEGTKLIEAARTNGIEIPSLCYKKELPHYTSCMVCMVKDVKKSRFIPSCSAIVEEGQIIDASGDEVKKLRTEALSLLLTEHRAECEAPCKLVCPDGLNIPQMNRYLMIGDLKSAADLIYKTMSAPGSSCENCPGYCEKACRRKMIDKTISIRNLIRLIISISDQEKIVGQMSQPSKVKMFNSTIGKIDENEKQEWLKECTDGGKRYSEPETLEEGIAEAANCMHCDCRALDNCSLRQLCDELNVKNPKRLRTGHPIEKKINRENGLIFENAKCIKCGLCVRQSNISTNDSALCFTGRGFMSLISEPLTTDFNSILSSGIDEVVNICPTGALSIIE